MAFAGKALGNPMGVVLGEQFLVLFLAGAIRAWIAPAVEQVAAFAAAAARMSRRFRCRRAMIDDPEFAEGMDADDKLIEIRIIGHGVEVRPIRVDAGWSPGRRVGPYIADRLELVQSVLGGGDRRQCVLTVID